MGTYIDRADTLPDSSNKSDFYTLVDTARAHTVADDDADTKIQVEESADEDIIRFDIGGTQTVVFGDGTNEELVKLTNTGTDSSLEVNSTSTGKGLVIDQDGNATALQIDSEATTAKVFLLEAQNTSGNVFEVKNEGNMTTNSVCQITQDHASSAADVSAIQNDGTGNGLYINQVGVNAATKRGLYVYSNTAQTTTELANFSLANGSSDKSVLRLENAGTGQALYIDQDGVAAAISLDVDGAAAPGIVIDQGSNGTHLRFTGDPTVASPVDGDLWWTGTALNFYNGAATTNLLATDKTSFGAWASGTIGSATQAATDLILTYEAVQDGGGSAATVTIKTDSANPPTVLRKSQYQGNTSQALSVSCPVKKDEYYLIEDTNTTSAAAYTIPLS